MSLIEEANVCACVATRDARYLLDQPPVQIPYWDGQRLIDLLLDPNLAAILPPVCRPPLTLAAATHSDAAFVPGGCPPELPGQEFARVRQLHHQRRCRRWPFRQRTNFPDTARIGHAIVLRPGHERIRVQLVEQPGGRSRNAPKPLGSGRRLR